MNRSVLISCRIKSMGKSTDKKSGVTGSRVPGCSTGVGGTGLSALMLYQDLGISLSFRRNRVWSVMGSSNGVYGMKIRRGEQGDFLQSLLCIPCALRGEW